MRNTKKGCSESGESRGGGKWALLLRQLTDQRNSETLQTTSVCNCPNCGEFHEIKMTSHDDIMYVKCPVNGKAYHI